MCFDVSEKLYARVRVKAQQQQSKYDEYKKKGCPTILGLQPLAESIKLVHKFLKCVLHS